MLTIIMYHPCYISQRETTIAEILDTICDIGVIVIHYAYDLNINCEPNKNVSQTCIRHLWRR